jgi:hypothetical protein
LALFALPNLSSIAQVVIGVCQIGSRALVVCGKCMFTPSGKLLSLRSRLSPANEGHATFGAVYACGPATTASRDYPFSVPHLKNGQGYKGVTLFIYIVINIPKEMH